MQVGGGGPNLLQAVPLRRWRVAVAVAMGNIAGYPTGAAGR